MFSRQTSNRRCVQKAQHEDGVVLLITVFLVAFSSLLVGGLLHSLTTDLQIAHNHLYSTKALYIADAGIEHALNELRNNPAPTWPHTETFPAGSSSQFTVNVTGSAPTYVITSTGTAAGFQRVVEAQVRIGNPPASPARVLYWKELP